MALGMRPFLRVAALAWVLAGTRQLNEGEFAAPATSSTCLLCVAPGQWSRFCPSLRTPRCRWRCRVRFHSPPALSGVKVRISILHACRIPDNFSPSSEIRSLDFWPDV